MKNWNVSGENVKFDKVKQNDVCRDTNVMKWNVMSLMWNVKQYQKLINPEEKEDTWKDKKKNNYNKLVIYELGQRKKF